MCIIANLRCLSVIYCPAAATITTTTTTTTATTSVNTATAFTVIIAAAAKLTVSLPSSPPPLQPLSLLLLSVVICRLSSSDYCSQGLWWDPTFFVVSSLSSLRYVWSSLLHCLCGFDEMRERVCVCECVLAMCMLHVCVCLQYKVDSC